MCACFTASFKCFPCTFLVSICRGEKASRSGECELQKAIGNRGTGMRTLPNPDLTALSKMKFEDRCLPLLYCRLKRTFVYGACPRCQIFAKGRENDLLDVYV